MIGRMIIGEHDEILRFIAGSIINRLANQGISQDLFWPKDNGVVFRTSFFQDQLDSPRWLERLKGHLDDVDSELKIHERFVDETNHSLTEELNRL